jgi:hypothetical protein
MRNVLNESCRENQNTRFVFSSPPPPENHAVYKKNVEKCGGAREAADNMAHACLVGASRQVHGSIVAVFETLNATSVDMRLDACANVRVPAWDRRTSLDTAARRKLPILTENRAHIL